VPGHSREPFIREPHQSMNFFDELPRAESRYHSETIMHWRATGDLLCRAAIAAVLFDLVRTGPSLSVIATP
jgi:hypothetical protein